MKRTIIATIIAVGVFAGVYGLAASLGVSSDSLGAGNAAVAACQSGTLTTTYAPTYTSAATAPATAAGYKATTVTIGNIAAGCQGKSYKVTLVDGSNVSLQEVTGTTPAATSMALTFGVNASQIEGVHVVITG